MNISKEYIDDFVSHVDKEKSKIFYDGIKCWEWSKACFPSGYGKTKINGKSFYAHRMAWIIEYGEIKNNYHVLHRCDNPSCCNPRHLFLGTHSDNMKDRDQKIRKKMGGDINAPLTDREAGRVKTELEQKKGKRLKLRELTKYSPAEIAQAHKLIAGEIARMAGRRES